MSVLGDRAGLERLAGSDSRNSHFSCGLQHVGDGRVADDLPAGE